jgi:hypothetical protein
MNRTARHFQRPTWRWDHFGNEDVDSDLQAHQTRYFDPTPGQWLNEEPIANASGDANLHPYVRAAPPAT